MNYADLFRVTLPETALEIAALLVLVVDLGLLRKAALERARWRWRRCWAWLDAARRCWRCRFRRRVGSTFRATTTCCWRRAGLRPWRRLGSWC